jgi:diacylglycerol kinase
VKNAAFIDRVGYAVAGIVAVWRSERSFRTQTGIAAAAVAVTALLQPGLVWAALVALAIALVLAFELMNSALEYAIDRLHPEVAPAIKRAKDAAAGAVLLASSGALAVGILLLAARWLA